MRRSLLPIIWTSLAVIAGCKGSPASEPADGPSAFDGRWTAADLPFEAASFTTSGSDRIAVFVAWADDDSRDAAVERARRMALDQAAQTRGTSVRSTSREYLETSDSADRSIDWFTYGSSVDAAASFAGRPTAMLPARNGQAAGSRGRGWHRGGRCTVGRRDGAAGTSGHAKAPARVRAAPPTAATTMLRSSRSAPACASISRPTRC